MKLKYKFLKLSISLLVLTAIIYAIHYHLNNEVSSRVNRKSNLSLQNDVTMKLRNNLLELLLDSEIQLETTSQRRVLINALQDLKSFQPDQFENIKYPDLDGTLNKRRLIDVLKDHLVPSTPKEITKHSLLDDLRNPEVISRIDSLIKELEEIDKQENDSN